MDIMRQSACLVVNPITVYSYGFIFHCTTEGQASDSMTALTLSFNRLVGTFACLWQGPPWVNLGFSLSRTVSESRPLFFVSSQFVNLIRLFLCGVTLQ